MAVHASDEGQGSKKYRIATQLVHLQNSLEDPYGAVSTPIYQTATFDQPSATTYGTLLGQRFIHLRVLFRTHVLFSNIFPPVSRLQPHTGKYDYTRSGNPTRTALEEQMARIEGADRSLAYASGNAWTSLPP